MTTGSNNNFTTTLESIAQKGNDAVKRLRLEKLRNGHPFMINCTDLEPRQCYLEYPDGSIKLVFLKHGAREFKEIRTLSPSEELSLRTKYDLSCI